MIVKEKGGYSVKSEDGKKHLGGPYKSKAEAEERLKNVDYYKHVGKMRGEKSPKGC